MMAAIHCFTLRAVFTLLLLVYPIFSFKYNQTQSNHKRLKHFHGCEIEFNGYFPSKYESLWYDNIESRQVAVCNQLHKEIPEQVVWFTHTQKYHDTHHVDLSEPNIKEVFSYFEYSKKCRGLLFFIFSSLDI
jgi:hypothetical protein